MKLLLDENLSRRVVPFIQNTYRGPTQVALVGLEQANDKIIRQWALIMISSLSQKMQTKIVWLKMGNQSKAETIKVLQDNRESIGQVLLIDDKACIEIL